MLFGTRKCEGGTLYYPIIDELFSDAQKLTTMGYDKDVIERVTHWVKAQADSFLEREMPILIIESAYDRESELITLTTLNYRDGATTVEEPYKHVIPHREAKFTIHQPNYGGALKESILITLGPLVPIDWSKYRVEDKIIAATVVQ